MIQVDITDIVIFLLDLCRRCGIFICNGRIFSDRNIGCNTCRDSSVVDYLIAHPNMFDIITDCVIEDFNPMFSDSFYYDINPQVLLLKKMLILIVLTSDGIIGKQMNLYRYCPTMIL